MSELVALLDGREVGRVQQQRGKLTFNYADSWRGALGAYPLSLSMPLASSEHSNAAIEPFIWGLLPDNELVLSRWAKQFQVSPRNAFALIRHVGEDCAGAVQFVAPERLNELTTAAPVEPEWLSEADVANRIRALQADASAWRAPRDTGQFSLAGAQPKTALLFDGQKWGVPSGRTPTTHILKPPTGGFDGHAENEHLCLRLAQSLGLPVAHSEVQQFENMTTIVVERYDRVNMLASLEKMAEMHAENVSKGNFIAALDVKSASKMENMLKQSRATPVYRVHQEDICQAMHIHPSLKYQNDGGPGPNQIVELLRSHVIDGRRSKQRANINAPEVDILTFVDALLFNWFIGGTDAHAKNYSILISGTVVRLAPLYDIASIFAYPEIDPRKAKLAMKIGDEYKVHAVRLSDWRKLAASVRVDSDALIGRIRTMALELPDRLSDEIRTMYGTGLNHKVIDRLGKILPERAAKVSAL